MKRILKEIRRKLPWGMFALIVVVSVVCAMKTRPSINVTHEKVNIIKNVGTKYNLKNPDPRNKVENKGLSGSEYKDLDEALLKVIEETEE